MTFSHPQFTLCDAQVGQVGVSEGSIHPSQERMVLLAGGQATAECKWPCWLTVFLDPEHCFGLYSTWRDEENALQDFILGDL